MPIFLVNGLAYHVEVQGSGAPLMLLHGFTGSAEDWREIVEGLQGRCQVIMVDLLGHGQTDAPDNAVRYQIVFAAADLAALVKLISADPVHLLGYSMGGRLALYMALHYPGLVRTLILESASPGLATKGERQARRASDDTLADRIERDGIAAFIDYWENLPLLATHQHLSPETRARLRSLRLQNRPGGLANSLRGMGNGVQPSLWESLARLSTPALLLSGALDAKFTGIAQQMHAKIPGSELNIVPGAGHTIHLEQPALFLHRLTAWLDKVT